MSLVITLFVREGIVMAADSRLTLSTTTQQGPTSVVQLAAGQSDTMNKLFLADGRIGLSTFGAADIAGVPITGYIESVVAQLPAGVTVDVTASALLAFFRTLTPIPATWFVVAGYQADASGELAQRVVEVDLAANTTTPVNVPGGQGARWGGEVDILTRLLNQVLEVIPGGTRALPTYQIPWGFFTLQDAIDFATYAVHSTIGALRFQPRAKTVGGPIDVLVIRPSGAQWIQRKELHA